MDQRRIPSFTPDDYQHIIDLSISHDPYHCSPHGSVSPEPRQGSFVENAALHSLLHDYPAAPVTRGAEGMFDPWLLQQASCGSPLSTSSSITPCERVSTPEDTGHQMYQILDQPLRDPIPATGLSGCWVGPSQGGWQQDYSETDVWSAQTPLHSWGGGGYTGVPPPTMEPSYQPVSHETAPSFSYPLRNQFTSAPAVDSAPFRLAEAPSAKDESSDDMDSASDDSDYEESNSNKGQAKASSSKRKSNRTISPVLNLGKWSIAVDPYAQPEQRNYMCPLSSKSGASHACQQRFVRPEHLRRHVKTVHGNKRDYKCKVPQCKRAFSRGDNLRDHYWTHLSRGGRAGRNNKMDLEELTAILGPKERKLARRLRRRLVLYTQKKPILYKSKL